jgi:hypothetical protein
MRKLLAGVAAKGTSKRFTRGRLAQLLIVLPFCYFVVAYLVIPWVWMGYAYRHPAIDATPGVTTTGDDHSGDPINVCVIGSEADLKHAMSHAGWFLADHLGLAPDLKIAADTVLGRSYDTAPVSKLFLWGRKEDLAFEQPVGNDPSQRHHVRFWKSQQLDALSRPAWMGSATYDERVGLSHTTGQITHHIDGDIDIERDHLVESLQRAGNVSNLHEIKQFHRVHQGVNGGGDKWHTDGSLSVAALKMQ